MRFKALNYLRALTALSVVLTHFGSPKGFLENVFDTYHSLVRILLWSNGGLHFGVIIFVVMSGFLIHLTSKTTPLKDYYIKRLIRILPLFLITATVAYIFSDGVVFDFLLNITLLSSVVPNDGPPGNHILLTVIVEIVIYLVYPLFRKWSYLRILISAIAIYFASITLYTVIGAEGVYIQRTFLILLPYWMIGVCGVHFVSNPQKLPANKAILLLVFCYLLISNLFKFTGSHYIYGLVLAYLISLFLAKIYILEISKPVINLKILNTLGEAAYSMYAWHWIILSEALLIFDMWSTTNYTITIVFTLIISILSYTYVEMPFNRLRRKLIVS